MGLPGLQANSNTICNNLKNKNTSHICVIPQNDQFSHNGDLLYFFKKQNLATKLVVT